MSPYLRVPYSISLGKLLLVFIIACARILSIYFEKSRIMLFGDVLNLCSPDKIIQRNVEHIRNSKQDLQLGFPRHQLIILVCLFRYITVDRSLILREALRFPALL